MLSLKLSDYLADCHIWICVFSCPCPSPFTHTQRLTVCLLLLLGYTCVNTLIISQMDEQVSSCKPWKFEACTCLNMIPVQLCCLISCSQLPFELGIIDVSAISVATGLSSVLAVLPAATVISFLFRWRKVKLMGSGARHAKGRKIEKDYFEGELWTCIE